jgi:hypothetical protein
MTKVTVYRFKHWSIETGGWVADSRMATREAIARVKGTCIENTATEIDAALVGREEPGMTDKDFHPGGDAHSPCQAGRTAIASALIQIVPRIVE